MLNELVSNARHSRQRARAARQSANQCKQRAAILFCSAETLLARFDELERRMLLRTRLSNRAPSVGQLHKPDWR